LRSLSESISNALFTGRSKINPISKSNYKSGWHTTWDDKKVFLRSSYELDYAKQLDDYKIRYEVESIRIKYFDTLLNRERTAISDFYLLDLNMIVEIKSSYTFDIINTKEKALTFKNNGYNYKLILDKKDCTEKIK